MKVFFPTTTKEIIHKSKDGTTYQLDVFANLVSLYESLKTNPQFSIEEIEIKDETDTRISLATTIINGIHNPSILQSYKTGISTSLANSSGIMWQPKLYNYSLEQALISKNAVDEAVQNSGAVAIAEGGHHAQIDIPYGFCAVNTMAMSAIYAKSLGYKVVVIDLDTHFSNGCIDILKDKSDIFLFSLWNQKLDKWKYYDSQNNIWHEKVTDVIDYFKKLDELVKKVKELRPTFIIYQLGLDVLETDRMGGVKGMTNEKLSQRDTTVSNLINDLNSKFVIYFGGSYIDRSKNEEDIIKQKRNILELQNKILNYYLIKSSLT